MTQLHHHASHFQKFIPGLAVGFKFKRGDVLAYVGNTGKSTAPHVHYEIMRKKPESWTQYISGMSKQDVADLYIDPISYIDIQDDIPAPFTHEGNGYLTALTNKNGVVYGYHPGVDINHGSPWSDQGNEFRATTDGEIVFVGFDGRSQGWGNHFWWIETTTQYDDWTILQLTEAGKPGSGGFALILGGKKRVVQPDRLPAFNATVTKRIIQGRKLEAVDVDFKTWNDIPRGKDF